MSRMNGERLDLRSWRESGVGGVKRGVKIKCGYIIN